MSLTVLVPVISREYADNIIKEIPHNIDCVLIDTKEIPINVNTQTPKRRVQYIHAVGGYGQAINLALLNGIITDNILLLDCSGIFYNRDFFIQMNNRTGFYAMEHYAVIPICRFSWYGKPEKADNFSNIINRIRNPINVGTSFPRCTIIVPIINEATIIQKMMAYQNTDNVVLLNNCGTSVLSKKMSEAISQAATDKIIIINPDEDNIHNIIYKFKNKLDNDNVLISNSSAYGGTIIPTSISCIAFDKSVYNGMTNKQHANFKDIITSIIEKSNITNKPKQQNKALPPNRKLVKFRETKDLPNISIILPFADFGDRWPIFNAVIKNLYELTKEIKSIEICVHESGPHRFITEKFIKDYNLRYLYTKWEETFHRSWNLNVSARYLAYGNYLCFFDGDMVVDKQWVKTLLKKSKENFCGHGWNRLIYAIEKPTEFFLANGKLPEHIDHNMEREPHFWNCAGGINVLSHDVFFDIGGWPEDFRGMWGGPDNAMVIKQMALGVYGGSFDSTIYHLKHQHVTAGDKQARQNILEPMTKWTETEWRRHIRKHDGFGDIGLVKEVHGIL